MMSEGVHSLVDTSNEFLLMYGLRRAALPPDLKHPFGYGRELYSGASSFRCSSSYLAPEFHSTKAFLASSIRSQYRM
jgi:hypothetical protein